MTSKAKGASKTGKPGTVRELEAKFRVHGPFTLPPLVADETPGAAGVAAVDEPRQVRMSATYYDTLDLRLAREGVTLRHRTGGDDAGWHLKLPVVGHSVADGVGARDELQYPDSDQLPADLRALVTPLVRSAPLGPVATLVTDRTILLLRGADGAALAELVDDTVSVGDETQVEATFREIEIEDLGGGQHTIAQVGALLQDAGAVGGEFVPKVVRALGPRATTPPDPPAPRDVAGRDPAADFVAMALRAAVRQLVAEDVRLRRGLPDAVHQMRVATRRVRAILKAFGPLLDSAWASALGEDVEWLGGVLGAARDSEVLRAGLLAEIDLLPDAANPEAVRAKLLPDCDNAVAAARTAALAALDDPRYVALLDRLVDAACYPRTTDLARRPCGAVLPPLVKQRWDDVRRRAAAVRGDGRTARAPDGVQPDAADCHRLRIAAKRLRYAAEAVEPVFGAEARALARQAEKLQDLLGGYRDATAAAGYLEEAAKRPRVGSAAFGFGVIYARQTQTAARVGQQLSRIWPDVSRPRYRRWLAD